MKLRDELRSLDRLSQLYVALCAAYVAWFVACQLIDFFDPFLLEWDARGMLLIAFRDHDHHLLARDLATARAAAMAPIGWRAIFWIGTSIVSPTLLCRTLPFVLFGVLLWQAFAFGRRQAGIVTGASIVLLVTLSPFFWDRIVGANPRAFGLPLVVAFLRYGAEKRERPVLIVLALCGALYPSVLLVCGVAWGVEVLIVAVRTRDLAPLGRLALCALVCAAFAAPLVVGPNPQIGTAVTLEEMEHLAQRYNNGTYPLPPIGLDVERAVHLVLTDETGKAISAIAPTAKYVVLALAAIYLVLGLRRARPPLLFLVTFVMAGVVYLVARAVAYRLYIPDRVLHYAWTPLIALLVPVAGAKLGRPIWTGLAFFIAYACANGFAPVRLYGMHDWRGHDTPTIQFIATLPKDALVAASVDASSYVELYAQRNALCSGSSNAPNFGEFSREIERRIGAWYDAYYASSMDDVKRFARRYDVDYLVVDERDFGDDALERATYSFPWTERASALIRRCPPSKMPLAHPPDRAIVFRDHTMVVLDTKRL